MSDDTRLIERWLPIAEIGIEAVRERTPMTPFPAPNRLHVWWARRPLVASRAAVLASLLPADADRDKFMHVLGIHGDPVKAKNLMARLRRKNERMPANPYGYKRAFSYTPQPPDLAWLNENITTPPVVLDPTAGGGSVPLEVARCGFFGLANDINPVSSLLIRATAELPIKFGEDLAQRFAKISARWIDKLEEVLFPLFPQVYDPEEKQDTNYLWARTVTCPYCSGRIPLSPNWRLDDKGTGVRVIADTKNKQCRFEIVNKPSEHADPTVSGGKSMCPYDDCKRIVDSEEIKKQACAGQMGEQLYAVIYKEKVIVTTKTGKKKVKWVRGFRTPQLEDDNAEQINRTLAEKLEDWKIRKIIPTEKFPENSSDSRPIQYGMYHWTDLFSPRQLLCHGFGVEVFNELLQRDEADKKLDELERAAYLYLALTIDTLLSYSNRLCFWVSSTQRTGQIFARHDFAFISSYTEMSAICMGSSCIWARKKVLECIEELITLSASESTRLLRSDNNRQPITVTCQSADSLHHIMDTSIDCVIMDPPYYDNVMYAELSDFFYVWLKRTAGKLYPDLFRRQLTDKINEAVANPAKFNGKESSKALAKRDYQDRMTAIFDECHRVLKDDGILTLMFTHKAAGAWDALTVGLMQAGFIITASWPVATEAGGLHIRDKAAANSTIFLVCRPRPLRDSNAETVYWEDVEPQVRQAVRARVAEFQAAGIRGVDLYLACFGPALEEFSRHWPLKRGTPRPRPTVRGQSRELFDDFDPFAAMPEDALTAARREVKQWRLGQISQRGAQAAENIDAITAFFILAWDTFEAPVFDYDEALRLARAIGVDLEKDIIGSLCEKKGNKIRLWDSQTRADKNTLGAVKGQPVMINALHRAAHLMRKHGKETTLEMLRDVPPEDFINALSALLEVLPVSTKISEVKMTGDLARFGDDFQMLYDLYRLAFTDKMKEPEQLKLWREQ